LELIKEVYKLYGKLPKNEERNLVDQLRRAVVSVNLNIAEGSGSENDVEFKRYLFITKKSLFEVIAILKVIEKLYNIKIDLVLEKIELLSKLISGLIKYLKNSSLKT